MFIIEGSYVHARVREADRAKFPLIERRGSHAHMTVHSICHGYQMLDLKTGDEPAPFDIELDPGRKLTGTLVGPDGKPATGVVAYGLIGESTRDGKGVSIDRIAGSFSVSGLDPGAKGHGRSCSSRRSAAGSAVLHCGATSRLRCRCNSTAGPPRWDGWLTQTARRSPGALAISAPAFPAPVSLTDDKGNSAPDAKYGNPWPRPVQTDNEGRFRSDGLVPGMTYELVFVTPVKKESYMVGEARTIETAVSSTAGEVIKGLSLAPGEVRDVATVRVESAKRPAGDGPK